MAARVQRKSSPDKPKKVRRQSPLLYAKPYSLGQPLTSELARSYVLEFFRQQRVWHRNKLADSVEQAHVNAGGLPGKRTARLYVGDILSDLHKCRHIENDLPSIWRLVSDPPKLLPYQAPLTYPSCESIQKLDSETSRPELADSSIEQEKLNTSSHIGVGAEAVGVFYHPNDRELAALKGKNAWECQIKTIADPNPPLSTRRPIIGLVIRCENAIEMEAVLKASLKIAKREIPDALDSDWFYTSPDAVKHWFVSFQQSLAQFSTAS
ncbi:MAG: hypothetical protein EOP04_12900 [Proteobacteria bacterium]|nr:MAG: hypothetical protein EOP04_12900 [Pseudomonadota bacterium]